MQGRVPLNPVVYVAPGATTIINIAPLINNYIIISDGTIDVQVNGEGKSCIKSIKVDPSTGSNSTQKYKKYKYSHLKSNPNIDITIKSTCKTPVRATVTITFHQQSNNEEDIRQTTMVITLRPLSVSFEDLIRVVTNPHFSNINNKTSLATEVGDLLLKAIAGDITDWSQVQPSNTGSAPVDLGKDVKVVAKFNGTDYCFYSPSMDNWEWELCSSTGWPVWVKDAKEWENLKPGSCALPSNQNTNENKKSIYSIVSSTYDTKEYSTYLLTVKFGGSECDGLSGYGNRKQLVEKMLSWNNLAYYTGACFIGAELCNGIRLATGDISSLKGATVDAVVGCALAPTLAGFATRMNIATEHPTTTALTAFALGPMTPAIYHGVVSPNVRAWRLSRTLTGFKSSYLVQKTVDRTKTYKIVQMLEGSDAEAARKELEKLKKTLEEIKELGLAGGDQAIDDAIKNIDTLIDFGREGTEISGTQAITAARKLGDSLDDLAKSLKRSIKTAFNVGDIACGAIGTLTGTVAYYAHAGSITIPTLNIDMKNILTAAVISVPGKNEIVMGATE